MKKQELEAVFESAKTDYAKYIGVSIETDGNAAPEIIINPFDNYGEKLRHYKEAYDEDMELIATKGRKRIAIIAAAQGNSFSDIEWQLTEEREDWKRLISDAIDRVTIKELEKHPDVESEKKTNIEMMLEAIKQSFTEKKYSPSQQKFIIENIGIYEEMFEVCMNGSGEEFKEKFLQLSKRLGEV